MERIILIAVTALLCATLNLCAQEAEVQWGVKGGANYSTFWNHLELDGHSGIEYSGKAGFFAGALANVSISKKFKVQPELLFAYRNSGIKMGGFQVGPDFTISYYRSTVTESVLALPVLLQYYPFEKCYLEAGPEVGYIIQRNEEIEEDPFGRNEAISYDFDRIGAGISAGVGINISPDLGINARYFA